MNFSASQLVKESASQILYRLIKNPPKKVSLKQLKGNDYAKKVSSNYKGSFKEMRGIFSVHKDSLFFCVDLVKDDTFFEIKSLQEPKYADWYLNQSILQSAFYSELLRRVDHLDTPTFLLKNGVKNRRIWVPKSPKFKLLFGDKLKIDIGKNEEVFRFYINKLETIKHAFNQRDFKITKEFDSKYKHKEFEFLNPKYKIIK